MTGVWHDGEVRLQTSAGTAARLAVQGPKVIRPFMPDQHRGFFAQVPFLVAGALDAEEWPVASILSGPPGFAHSPDPTRLRIDALPAPGDPLAALVRPGRRLGLLGIELPTRRRNRLNGRVAAVDEGGFTLAVEESYGNCPQYIHRRAVMQVDPEPVGVERFTRLDDAADALIAASDTCFVATGVASGADVSHRGGAPGFLSRDQDGAILLPDYPGNGFFNTLGNVLVNPRIGLLLIDFARGDLLQISGTAELVQLPESGESRPRVDRWCRISPRGGAWLRHGFPFGSVLVERAPQIAA